MHNFEGIDEINLNKTEDEFTSKKTIAFDEEKGAGKAHGVGSPEVVLPF